MATKRDELAKDPLFRKYAKTARNDVDPDKKLRPSEFFKAPTNFSFDESSRIIELNNMADNTADIRSSVDTDQPLFQVSPKVVVFDDYAPFSVLERKLYFRNNDSVARRIKVFPPSDNPFFEISVPRTLTGEPLKQSKIAAGIEVCFILKFKPQEIREYSLDLICSTEREKFIVPIRATGHRPQITLPDEIKFPPSSVKSAVKKILLLQNIGVEEVKFVMTSMHNTITCPSEAIVMNPGSTQSVEIFFTPADSNFIQSEIIVEFIPGGRVFIAVSGQGENVDVVLSTPSLSMDPSFISLLSHRTLKIRNLSSQTVTYTWKSYSTLSEEDEERDRLLYEINRMESIEKNVLLDKVMGGGFESILEDEEAGFEPRIMDKEMTPFASHSEEAAFIRKYRNLRLALENDSMEFIDDIFEISPLTGTIWAGSEVEISVVFSPDTAANYTCIAYLDVTGREDRLPLHLSGRGIGPNASLSFDVLDIGDVFINLEQSYEMTISNKGDIVALWTFMPPQTKFGNKFTFYPKEGALKPGESETIMIGFESDVLGEFSEFFRFALQGNEHMLECNMKGHVIGPTFHFDSNLMDFGGVSYDYLHTRNIRLVNTSSIPIVFNLHVPQDGTHNKKEFDIMPPRGTLLSGDYIDVNVEFIPGSVKVYDYMLSVDVLGVGDMLLNIPITAECAVSPLRLAAREVPFGECFIRYPYEMQLTLTSTSDSSHTKFEILPQIEYTKAIATFEASPSISFVEPGGSMKVTIRMVPVKLGQFKIPVMISIAGSVDPPLQALLSCTCTGPKIVLDQTELRWGNIECLKDSPRILKLTNTSTIQATLQVFLRLARSKFELKVENIVLDAGESYDLEVIANLDDSIIIKEELHIMVNEGDNLMVLLSAKGVGTTMLCKQDISKVDIGVQLTNCPFEKTIVLENKGRRHQQLKWINKTNMEENQARLSKKGGALKKSIPPMFTVTPSEITLRPRTATAFTFKGTCAVPSVLKEVFILESKIGKERLMRPIIVSEVMCEVVNPLLEISDRNITFEYIWSENEQPYIQKREITLTNISTLALNFLLKTETPYNLSGYDFSLQPGEIVEVSVEFDPLYQDTKQSHTVDKFLTIVYRSHPHREKIKLHSDIIFPNLGFESTDVNFGCFLNDTSKRINIKVTNTSLVPAAYQWIFTEPIEPPGKKTLKMKTARATLTPSQVFDILPARNVLMPGESEDVEFTMTSGVDTKIKATAICVVLGGPEYRFSLSGESSTVGFLLDKSVLDFKNVVFTSRKDEELLITNTGKVIFDYEISGSQEALGLFEISPIQGKVNPGESQKIIFSVRPATPSRIAEIFSIKIAHFESVFVSCYCVGIFPAVVVTLPRQKKTGPFGEFSDFSSTTNLSGTSQTEIDTNFRAHNKDNKEDDKVSVTKLWADFHTFAQQNLIIPDVSTLAPSESSYPPLPCGTTALPPMRNLIQDPQDAMAMIGSHRNISSAVDKTPQSSIGSAKVLHKNMTTLIEIEMQRLVICHELDIKLKDIQNGVFNGVNGLPPDFSVNTGLVIPSLSGPGVKYQALLTKYVEMKSVISASYLCDFGNVVQGLKRKRIFKILNATAADSMTWTFDKKILNASGFTIDPEKIEKLPGLTSVDIAVVFTARVGGMQKLGRRYTVLPIDVKGGGPISQLILSANVCLPDVEISSETLDFDSVMIGRSRQIFVMLSNNSPVSAKWDFKVPTGKDEARFIISPNSGTLRSGAKEVVCVEFLPVEAKKYSLDVALRVDLNAKTRTLKIFGEGAGSILRFDPGSLDLGTVLPMSPGVERTVTLTSQCAVPIEVYSLDFDKNYLEEEEMLNTVNIYDFHGMYRTAVRNAGDGLPASIITSYKRIVKDQLREKKRLEELEIKNSTDNGEENAENTNEFERQNSKDLHEDSYEEPIVFITPPIRVLSAPRDGNQHQDIVLYGLPLTGTTSVSEKLSKKLHLIVRNVDEILNEIAITDCEIGTLVRLCLNLSSESEKIDRKMELEKLLLLSEESKKIQAEALKKEKKKPKEPVPEIPPSAETLAYESLVENGVLNMENLSRIIAFRLSWSDVGSGIILDGFYSSHIEEKDVIKAVAVAMPEAVVALMRVAGEDAGYAAKLSNLFVAKANEMDRLARALERAANSAHPTTANPSGVLTGRKGKDQPVTVIPPELLESLDDDEPCLPLGDESWVAADTGMVLELSAQDLKALDKTQRDLYAKQLRYQQTVQLTAAEVVIRRVLRIWYPDTGLVGHVGQTTMEPVDEIDENAKREELNTKRNQMLGSSSSSDDFQERSLSMILLEPSAQLQALLDEAKSKNAGDKGAKGGNVKSDSSIGGESLGSGKGSVKTEVKQVPARDELSYSAYVTNVLPIITECFKIKETMEASNEEKVDEIASNLEGMGVGGGAGGGEEKSAESSIGGDMNARKCNSIPEYGLFDILVEADEGVKEIYRNLMALLPPPKVPAADGMILPPTADFQILRKPYVRIGRKAVTKFSILSIEDVSLSLKHAEIAQAAASQLSATTPNKKTKPGSAKKGAVPNSVGGAVPPPDFPPFDDSSTIFGERWVIEPFGSIKMKIRFRSEKEGKSDASLGFEVVGTGQSVTLLCQGNCEVPHITADPRNIFMRRLKGLPTLPNAPPPQKRFLMNENFYSFGPLQIFKKSDWRNIVIKPGNTEDEILNNQLIQANYDVMRITNDGKFQCTVTLAFKETDTVFFIEPNVIDLEEGETKEVKIWAFPNAIQEFQNTIIATIPLNPVPVEFPLTCHGVSPTVSIDGPWTEQILQAELAVTNCIDKKLLKDLETKYQSLKETSMLDFGRILIGKSDIRVFTIRNTSTLPVGWEVNLGDFTDSPHLTIFPLRGVIPVNGTQSVTLSFTSYTPLMLAGKFTVRYSDVEGGLTTTARVGTRGFQAAAESYCISAVTLSADGSEEGGNEVDFGVMCVGEVAEKKMSIGNKGKYKISYKFIFTRPGLAKLLKISPMEGFIEAGGKDLAVIGLTFCSTEAVHLVGNKHVSLQLLEPITGELVESFPLSISTQTKYNTFRLQPSKGVTFGAVKFDSEPRTKKIELRNEGIFDFTYVVCGAIAEHDELDLLDGPSYTSIALGIPHAFRPKLLGEKYLTKLTGFGVKFEKQGGPRPASSKKGGKEAPKKVEIKAPVADGQSGGINPCVFDPDGIPTTPLSETPLVVGAFSLCPRIGVVSPGQVVSMDVTFDPTGCDSARERLRFVITGTDENEALFKTAALFDLTGDSCFPAIVTEDIPSIFEELEVVTSLSASLGEDSGGEGKYSKLPVGKVVFAEKERVLAWGAVMCGNQGSRGVMERIRITNPTKIDTKVKFKITSTEEAAELLAAGTVKTTKDVKAPKKDVKGKGAVAVIAEVAFIVQPEVLDIPPHEHRYVSVYFKPTEIKSYRAVFFAEVDDGGSTTTAKRKPIPGCGTSLVFDLGGSGTMPCITIEEPTLREADGSLIINFQKVHIDRVSKRRITIMNHGTMSATCLFDMSGAEEFEFSSRNASLTLESGQKEDLIVSFAPKTVKTLNEVLTATVRVSVLNNQFDQYQLKLKAIPYECDAIIDIDSDSNNSNNNNENDAFQSAQDEFTMTQINLAESPGNLCTSTYSIMLKSRSEHPLRFDFTVPEGTPNVLSFGPSSGHLGANNFKEIIVTLSTAEPVKLKKIPITCTLKRIEYVTPKIEPKIENKSGKNIEGESSKGASGGSENEEESEEFLAQKALWGMWDDNMKSIRPSTDADILLITTSQTAQAAYDKLVAEQMADKAKNKKVKPLPPCPPKCRLLMGPLSEEGTQMLYEIAPEPSFEFQPIDPQLITVNCSGVADAARFKCEGNNENINFKPTFMLQSTVHTFTFTNESDVNMPVKWSFDDIKRKSNTRQNATMSRPGTRAQVRRPSILNVPCPFSIEPMEWDMAPNSSKEFKLTFLPLDAEDFVFLLRGETSPVVLPTQDGPLLAPNSAQGSVRMVLRGVAKRPLCHFELIESPDYHTRRPSNMKNEFGMQSPIECSDIRVVEVESVGLRTRNTFRFHIINTTNENYEFNWLTVGDPSPFWRCVQTAGMLFAGKRIEMVFEYLPDDVAVAEAFFKFRLANIGLEQLFLFAGKVSEPKVFFSTAKVDFHSMVLGGEGNSETVYLENNEHLPFQFSFDRSALLQLEGTNGPIIDINPKAGTVLPHGKCPIVLTFRPQEEVVYNFNMQCEVKRKPTKLCINIKGEGYAVHPVLQLDGEDVNQSQTLRASPHINYIDFGAVQVNDRVLKKLSVSNSGKYNFDYVWDVDQMGSSIALTGGKMGGTLQKGGSLDYQITFAPLKEIALDGSVVTFTAAGKYTYTIVTRGVGVQPALRFNFMHFDFGACFVTSPGGTTVVEEQILRITNHDPTSNISIECVYQKTRALWVDCPPTMVAPGAVLEVPICFAPREVADYVFAVPFVVNGSGKLNVTIVGKGALARLEMANAGQRKIAFGVVNVGTEHRKIIPLVNRSKKPLIVQLIDEGSYGGGALADRCVEIFPRNEVTVMPRESLSVQVVFSPNRRVGVFSEDLFIKYAGLTRKLLVVSGKAQGNEISLDTDSLPFGAVVEDSQKMKKLSLDNSGDLPVSYQWNEGTFGPHFHITPLSGKLAPGSEAVFEVTFRPAGLDQDIRQDNMLLNILGASPLSLTCTGVCIVQPTDSAKTLQFNSLVRKDDIKPIKITNPTDKDWFLSPSLKSEHWHIPHEIKVPAKGSADLLVRYFPLTMCPPPASAAAVKAPAKGKGVEIAPVEEVVTDNGHTAQLFLGLPDGTAQLYHLRGYADKPECTSEIVLESSAKKSVSTTIQLDNWLSSTQRFQVTIAFTEKPSSATFVTISDVVEISANSSKEFPLRFISYVEGVTKGTVTFTNTVTGEYLFYNLRVKTSVSEVLETIKIESPLRQTARYVVTVENPLGADAAIAMGSSAKPTEWWTCDSKSINLLELSPMTGNTEGSFEIQYRPLLLNAQPIDALLTLITKELGVFKYKLVLTTSPPALRKMLQFEVPLGAVQSESFLFKAFNTVKCDFACSTKQPDIFSVQKVLSVDPAVNGWEGDDVRLSVSFEPSEIGIIRDVLTVTSPVSGEYLCDIVATCVAPLPQGPFNFNRGGGASDVPFRNCFSTSCVWQYSVDSPAFRLTSAQSTVAAKTQGLCSVIFDPQADLFTTPGGVIAAKLFITCASKPDMPPWVFYLRGNIGTGGEAPSSPVKGGKK